MVTTSKYMKKQPKKIKKFASGGLVDEKGGKPDKYWRELRPDPDELVDDSTGKAPGKDWRGLTTRESYDKKMKRLRGEVEEGEQAARDFQSGKR